MHYVVLRPVRAITRATELRRKGDPTAWALVLAEDEMGMLARKINQANASVDATMQDLLAEKQATEELSLALRLRMRQAACLAEVLTLCQRSTLNEDALLQSIVELLPAACRFPDVATACVPLEQRIFQSARFEPSEVTLSLPIRVQGTVVGRVDVAYMRALPDADRAFLEEERILVDAIAGAIGETLQRRRGERDLTRSRGLLEGVGLSQSLFIEGRTPQVVFDQALNLLLEVTGSEYGFIGEVLRADTNKPYLRTFALTNIAWDDETRAFYAKHAPDGMEFHNLESLFGAVMTSEALVIANQPAVDPRRTGVPPGHPPLNAFMGVPIHAGGELVGMIGVANREGGYETDMASFLKPLLLTCGNLIIAFRNERCRLAAEAELRMHRDHLSDLVDEQTASIVAARDYAERANRTKSEFLANMSYELRTPLHAVMSFAQLGVDRAGTAEREKLAHYFGNVHKSTQRLLRLLNDLLDLAKLEAGKMRLDMAVHDLAEVIRDALAEPSALAQTKGIEIIVEHKGEPVDIACDRIRILQVVCILLSNALKFSTAGSVVRLRVSPCEMRAGRRTDDQGTRAGGRIEVVDQGVGVPEEELDAIFEKFIQSSKTKSGAGGTGLGLAICREIVAGHGGHIAARNNLTGGATFSVVLPAQVQGLIRDSAGAVESRTA
ncbi:MAG: GAF domain-containing protein [Betaproteobacteria bacterium]|nr:GAF domain-containing protein [Betaproteobacteria bacterium]